MSLYTKLAPQIWSEIQKADKILLHLHPGPDGDSVGSALALGLALNNLGKKVTIISGDSSTPTSFLTLPGSNLITQANYFEVDLKKFDLFIIPDTSSLNQVSKKGEVIFPKSLRTINIDHHASNSGFTDISIIDLKSPATCQIVYLLFELLKIKITPEIAGCLLLGIHTDTGGYKYPPTSSTTFKIASELSVICPNFSEIIFNFENNDKPSRLKLVGLLLSNIKLYFNGHLAVASVTQKQLLKNNIESEVVSSLDVANMLKAVIGYDIAATLIGGIDSKVKLSLRTRDPNKYDLSKIAISTGFGGGHKAAAGASLPFGLNKSTKILLNTVAKLHPELGEP